jgi:acetyltransferase-like isoleucine patch superfamily enzyme
MSNTIDPSAFIHSHALVEPGATIGPSSRIWAFAHVLPGAFIGEDCNICDHTYVETGVQIGNRVTIKCGVFIPDGVRIEDDVFVGPCVTFANDRRPRSKQYPEQWATTVLMRGCSIGANASLLPGIRIGRWAMVAIGSVVMKDVPDHAMVFGNPARIQCWVCRCGERLAFNNNDHTECSCGRSYRIQENNVKELKESDLSSNRLVTPRL